MSKGFLIFLSQYSLSMLVKKKKGGGAGAGQGEIREEEGKGGKGAGWRRETQICFICFSSLKSLQHSKTHTNFTKYSGMKTFPSVHYQIASPSGNRRNP